MTLPSLSNRPWTPSSDKHSGIFLSNNSRASLAGSCPGGVMENRKADAKGQVISAHQGLQRRRWIYQVGTCWTSSSSVWSCCGQKRRVQQQHITGCLVECFRKL